MTNRKLTYVVTAPSYSASNGGAIFQHNLVDTLNRMGERALLWPQPPHRKLFLKQRVNRLLKPPKFKTSPDLNTPIATRKDIGPDTIVVYPEIILGNPLKAKNVVRWLLYPPGVLHPYAFGDDEMFFTAGPMSDLPAITGGAEELYLWKINPAYRNENRPDRKGVCYMVRKGVDKPRIPETEAPDALLIERKSHEEVAEIFNRHEIFYSYDEATMYSQFAALCGCTSVVIPGMHKSREDWVAAHELARYGVAYGLDDLDHARATQHLLADLLAEKEAKSLETVERFVALTRERFGQA